MPLPRPAPGTTRWWVIGVLGCVSAVVVIVWWGIVSTAGSVRPAGRARSTRVAS